MPPVEVGKGFLAARYDNDRFRPPPTRVYREKRTVMDDRRDADFRTQRFALDLRAVLMVLWPGYYQIGVESDDDGRLYLDGRRIVDNTGRHPMRRRLAEVWLWPGPHLLAVEYANRGGRAGLVVWWKPPLGRLGPLPVERLRPVCRIFGHAQARDRYQAFLRLLIPGVVLIWGGAFWVLAGIWFPGWRGRLAARWREIRKRRRESPPPRLHPVVRWFALAVLVVAGVVMLRNALVHPPQKSHGYTRQLMCVERNMSLQYWLPRKGVYQYEYNPPYYYYFLGKLAGLVRLYLGPVHPYYPFRLAQWVMWLGVAALLCFSLLPRLTQEPWLQAWFVLALFAVPNLYLTLVMVRADNLFLPLAGLLFYLWFRFDFPRHLSRSRWRLVVLVLLLVALANSRSFSLAIFLVFGTWGLWLLLKDAWRRREVRAWLKVGLAILTVVAGAGHYYLYRYATTGLLFTQNQMVDSYHRYYYRKQIGFDRWPMFLNLRFDRVVKRPDRYAFYDGPHHGNAIWPRLYADMWADHWGYFSTAEDTVARKQVVLVAASVFSLAYFLLPVALALGSLANLWRRRPLSWHQTAAFIFTGGLILLSVFVWKEPEVGKNATVKFTYILAYYWAPFFCLLRLLSGRPRWQRIWFAYTAALVVLCFPFYLWAWS
jgi:hypothetical protein